MTNQQSPGGEPLLHAKEVATLLQVRITTVYSMAREGKLPCVRIGTRAMRFRPSTVQQWLAAHETTEAVNAG